MNMEIDLLVDAEEVELKKDKSKDPLATEENKVLNKDDSKEIFMELIQQNFRTSFLPEKRESVHLMEEFSDIIFKEINFKQRILKLPQYEATEKDGKYTVTQTDREMSLKVLPFTKIFDMLMKSHIANGHTITDTEITNIETQYVIPSLCFDLIPKVCKTCNKSGNNTLRNGIVTFLHSLVLRGSSQKKANTDSILIYLDEFSEFMVLRPCAGTDEIDITLEIFKIFMQFGPADKLYVYPKPKITQSLNKTLTTLFPQCKVIIEPRYKESYFSAVVMRKIVKWMTETKSKSWEVGCSLIQQQLNCLVKPGTEKPITAFDLYFNRANNRRLKYLDELTKPKKRKHDEIDEKTASNETRDASENDSSEEEDESSENSSS